MSSSFKALLSAEFGSISGSLTILSIVLEIDWIRFLSVNLALTLVSALAEISVFSSLIVSIVLLNSFSSGLAVLFFSKIAVTLSKC